jgi:hypothetical protein
MRSVLVMLALLSMTARARAQDDDQPPTKQRQWRIVLGMPENPDNQDGRHIQIWWKRYDATDPAKIMVFRRPVADGETPKQGGGSVDMASAGELGEAFTSGVLTFEDAGKSTKITHKAIPLAGHAFAPGETVGVWTLIAIDDDDKTFVDEVEPGGRYVYAVVPFTPATEDGQVAGFPEPAVQTWAVSPQNSWFNPNRWFFLTFIGLTAIAFFVYARIARTRAKTMFIRRIPGVDAIEDAIGRSTEMGRPVLYVTGTEEIQDIQTMASLLILGHVAQMTAEYDTEIKVANLYPLTMVVAEEIVRQGYSNAGRIDAHKPENVMFITSEQFAYAAAINGMILRDKPATNIFLGRFFAESLLLSETGYLVGAVQIAGTAEFTQLPFFIAACDYTLIGEELYATSAYLTREPVLMAQLKAGDVMKLLIMATIIIGVALATLGVYEIGPRLVP